jgi:RNA polymerase sigma-70 factor (ECF subfamily)
MHSEPPDTESLLNGLRRGEPRVLAALFEYYAPRLRNMVRLRMGPSLQHRLDISDVLQEAYLDAARKVGGYVQEPKAVFYVWLRGVVEERLMILQRHHLGAKCRAVTREVPLPPESSTALARQLLARGSTPSQKLIKHELQRQVQHALSELDADDREVILMRHFEGMSNMEVAQSLGIGESGSTMRYGRALRRLKEILGAKFMSSEARP